MRKFHYLSGPCHQDDEDLAQEAWCKALAKTDQRPNARTPQELIDNYQHIAGLVTHIFNQERGLQRRKPDMTVPLTDEVAVWYTTEDALEDCTPQQLKAISYYLSVIDQGRPLTMRERAKLARLRKSTGLALVVPRQREDS
jgi:DNA-directed RNA polymerase specialized sigma24 family protein